MQQVGFLPFSPLFGGVAFGPRFDMWFMLATLYHSQIIVRADREAVELLYSHLAEHGGVSVDSLRRLFVSAYDVEGLRGAEELTKTSFDEFLGKPWDSNGQIRRGLRGAVHEALAIESGISMRQVQRNLRKPWPEGRAWIKEAAAHAVAASSGAEAWRIVNQIQPCNMISFSPAFAYAAKSRIATPISGMDANAVKEIEMTIPSVANIEWDRILELREHKHLTAFRAWVEKGLEPDKQEDVVDGLWEAFGQLVPNPSKTHLSKSAVAISSQ